MASASRSRAALTPIRRMEPSLKRALTLSRWLPLLFAAAYALLFLANLRSLVQSIYLHADIVSAPYIGELYGHAPRGAEVLLGNISWFPALWFELATHGLPAHRQIWELAPYALSLLGIGLVAWSAFRAAGRWPALVTAAVLFAASPQLLPLQFGWSIHALTYVEVAVLGAFLVLCVARGGRIGGAAVHLSLVGLVGAVAAVGLASDKLLGLAGLAPFVLAAIATLWLEPRQVGRRVAASAAGVTAVGAVGAVLLHKATTADHIVSARFPITFVSYDQITLHVRLLVQSMAYLFYGYFGGLALSFTSVLKFICAAIVAIALIAGLAAIRTHARQLPLLRSRPADRMSGPYVAHVTFWGLVVCLTTLGYVFSSVASDPFTGRYLVPAAYGLAAVLSVVAVSSSRRRVAVVLGACTLMLASTIASARHELQADPADYPTGAQSGPLARLARADGLKYGYAGYWDAAPITWQTKTAIQVYPVIPCAATLCPMYLHQISSWYKPRPGIRTFLVSDPTQPANPTPPPSLGAPEQTVQINRLTVYIYSYDIASKFGP